MAEENKKENQAYREKTNMEILVEIRDYRNRELREKSNTSVSVVTVEFLGQGEQTGERFFRLFEQQEYSDKPTQVFEKYYMYKDDMPVLIGGKDPKTGEVLPVGMQGDKNESWDIIKQDIDKCIEVREKEYEEQLKIWAKELGIKEKDIANLSIEELSRIVAEKESEQLGEKESLEEENVKELSEEEIKNIGGVSNEINLDVVIDGKGTTLGDALTLEDYVSIIPIASYKLNSLNTKEENSENPRVPYALVGKRKDGTYATLPSNIIRLYRGGNTESTKINDTDNVEHSFKEDSIYEVVGTNERLIINQDNSGRLNVYYGEATRTNDGNVFRKLQDRYDGTKGTAIEIRELFNPNKGTDQMQKMEDEADMHFENANCPAGRDGKIEGSNALDAVDGDRGTGHQHTEEKTILENGTVIEWKTVELISEKCGGVSIPEAIRYLNQIAKENNIKQMTEDEIIYEAQEIAEKEYCGEKGRGPRGG